MNPIGYKYNTMLKEPNIGIFIRNKIKTVGHIFSIRTWHLLEVDNHRFVHMQTRRLVTIVKSRTV